MNANKVFIVNDENGGTRVVTKGILAEDIKSQLNQNSLGKVRTKDIEAYADELMNNLTGKAMVEGEYIAELAWAVEALRDFSALTPYKYAQLIRNYSD